MILLLVRYGTHTTQFYSLPIVQQYEYLLPGMQYVHTQRTPVRVQAVLSLFVQQQCSTPWSYLTPHSSCTRTLVYSIVRVSPTRYAARANATYTGTSTSSIIYIRTAAVFYSMPLSAPWTLLFVAVCRRLTCVLISTAFLCPE